MRPTVDTRRQWKSSSRPLLGCPTAWSRPRNAWVSRYAPEGHKLNSIVSGAALKTKDEVCLWLVITLYIFSIYKNTEIERYIERLGRAGHTHRRYVERPGRSERNAKHCDTGAG